MRNLLAKVKQARFLLPRIVQQSTTFQASTWRTEHLLRPTLAIALISASIFWASIAHAQTSCGELWLFVHSGGDILWCDQGQQYYTVVDTYISPPYSETDPLVTTYTGGKSNTREPYYPSYETWNGACAADSDKFSPTITIRFNKPVANVRTKLVHYMNQAIGYTVVGNNGAVAKVTLAPYQSTPGRYPFTEVILPGDNITSLTITPDSYGPDGEWHYLIYHDVFVTPPDALTNCNCNRSTVQRPTTQNVSTTWPLGSDGTDPNWNMLAEISDKDGLVLKDVKLGQRYMIEQISVPYFYLETSGLPNTRGELRPDGSETVMRSRLVNYYVNTDADKLVIEAQYVIDKIPATSLSCLHVIQRYEFYQRKPGDQCEPSGKLPCSRWKPIVKYEFFGRNGEFLKSINIAQRQHRRVDGFAYNTVGLFRDNDTIPEIVGSLGLFGKKDNPLGNEWYDPIISKGKSANQWDNMHQTFAGVVDEPGIDWNLQGWDPRRPGCPECLHSHWRWGEVTGGENKGNLIGIPAGSTQDVDFAIVSNQSGEEHPLTPFKNLVQYWQSIRTFNTAGRNPLQIYRNSAPEDVVYWQSGTGYQHRDTFFAYGGFFNPPLTNRQLYSRSGGSVAVSAQSGISAKPTAEAVSSEDDLSSVTAEHVFLAGTTTPTAFDQALAGPFPTGYSLYNNLSYDITTTAESSGPYAVTFEVPSVGNQTTFDNLRIFHLEQDQFDPTKVIWLDRTVLSPDPEQPNFANKTLSARTTTLGQLVVASLTTPQPPITAIANIAVSISDLPGSLVAGSNLTYTVNVTNNGPQMATGIVLTSALSPQVRFISANTTQGSCTAEDGTVVCKLNALTATSTAVVTIVVKPTDEGSAIPPEGRVITNTVFAKAGEIDTDLSSNSATENTTVLPDPNKAPTVGITSPAAGSLFVGPANININLTATDTDGSVSSVAVYADGALLGMASSAGSGVYTFTWTSVAFGPHSLVAVATDNQNRTKVSEPVAFIVNGTATVAITSPTNLSLVSRPADVALTATAIANAGTIEKVDFYADGFLLLGAATFSVPDRYTLTWVSPSAGNHSLAAVVTDSSGVTTTSSSINIMVNDSPAVNVISPLEGSIHNAPLYISLSATANDSDGVIRSVEFYANGQQVGFFNINVYSSQFNTTWFIDVPGDYTLTAIARDHQGGVTTSTPVHITVNASPTVSLTAPAAGSVFNAPANVTLIANASDSDGSVTGVNFYAGGILIGPGALIGPNQYSINWEQTTPNSYALTATATDNRGGTTTSSPINVNVNVPPTVSIVSPANNAAFAAAASINLTANASDSGGSINKVEFFANGASVGIGTPNGNGQYTFNWTNVALGSYTITAVATDNVTTTTTSSPVNIKVNNPPTVSLSGPANGSQYSAPANISILANASDSDGTIARVDFYANGGFIGTGTPSGTNQFNFPWSNVGIGNYMLTAIAVDNTGLATNSGSVGIAVTSAVLFVTNSTTLNNTENSVKARLEALNHTVVVKSAASAVTGDATGKALVVISSTVTPTAVGTKFRTVTVPVLTWESGIYNNMGMTGSTNKDFGTKTNQTQLSVINSAHPLAAGFSGNLTVASSSILNWGKPNANAVSVAIVVGDTAKTVIFGYETGAVMPGLIAPARRVAFFMHDTTVLNSNGIGLLDAAIKWASGGG